MDLNQTLEDYFLGSHYLLLADFQRTFIQEAIDSYPNMPLLQQMYLDRMKSTYPDLFEKTKEKVSLQYEELNFTDDVDLSEVMLSQIKEYEQDKEAVYDKVFLNNGAKALDPLYHTKRYLDRVIPTILGLTALTLYAVTKELWCLGAFVGLESWRGMSILMGPGYLVKELDPKYGD